MSHTQRITCDFCGRGFDSYEGDIRPLVVKLDGPVIVDPPTKARRDSTGRVQALKVETSRVAHEEAIDASDACGACYDTLRQFIVNHRKTKKTGKSRRAK
jgi:hypothetical protein